MTTLTVTPEAMSEAAKQLAHDGIWVKRDVWTDDDGLEVPEGDPKAVNRDFIYEVDYDRIVALVVQHLDTSTSDTRSPRDEDAA